MDEHFCLTDEEPAFRESEDFAQADMLPPSHDASFDFSGVPASFAAAADAAAVRIRSRHRRMVIDIIATGQDLLDVKDKLGHGKFGPWVSHAIGWTDRTAQNYMSVARVFGSRPEIAAPFHPNAIYALSSKNMPVALREEILADAAAGKMPDAFEIKRRLREAIGTKTTTAGRDRGRAPHPSGSGCGSSVPSVTPLVKPGPEAIGETPSIVSDTPGNSDREKTTLGHATNGRAESVSADSEKDVKNAETVVRFLRKRLGEKFGRFQTVMRMIPPEIFMEALSSAPVPATSGKGTTIELGREDYTALQK